MLVLDAHIHCGLTLPFEQISALWQEGNIDGGVVFSPVEEIYDRFDSNFEDSDFYRESRKNVHQYLQSLNKDNVLPFWFVWNDFKLPAQGFKGVKWHRHSDEPNYNYDSPKCQEFIEYICSFKMPVTLEEEFQHTLDFVKRIDGKTPVIIPHFGGLNGGYQNLKRAGVFENTAIYVDTALAGTREVEDFAEAYGVERILFGSDFPFSRPVHERAKIERVFKGEDLQKVLGKNLLQIIPDKI